ncbi:MAG: hypothetical protein M0C28_46575 [Candidatus Moduliflexus flocculans]|nr:hypothetical protein [Candidatus Moduliflexus flocculans]
MNLSGEGAEWLVRRRGETLNALQHIVATVFRDSAARGAARRRRLPGLPAGQGRRAAQDGAVHGREGGERRARRRKWGR